MSRLVDPDTFFAPPERVLRRAPPKIIRNRRKNPLHPDEIKRLIYERSKEGTPIKTVHEGWIIVYWDDDTPGVPPVRRTAVVYVKDLDGVTRPATYHDVVKIRDAEMEFNGYVKCWLRMKGPEDR